MEEYTARKDICTQRIDIQIWDGNRVSIFNHGLVLQQCAEQVLPSLPITCIRQQGLLSWHNTTIQEQLHDSWATEMPSNVKEVHNFLHQPQTSQYMPNVCHADPETIDHLFRTCTFVRAMVRTLVSILIILLFLLSGSGLCQHNEPADIMKTKSPSEIAQLTIALHHPCHASHKASATPFLHSIFTAPLHCIRQLGMGYQSRDSHNTGVETGDKINELMGNQMMKMEAEIINEMAKQRLEANSASGMAVNDECKTKFLELKAKRNYRFIVFKIEENLQQIVVEKVGAPKDSYEKLCSSLPSDECRYAVYDFDFTTDENCQKSKIFFIAWSPDTSRVRSKMLYASSKDRFRRELDGVQVELQATDPSEMSFDIVKERAF
ncbi:hypothetical protein GOBAR_AA13430 [Gossypium barbadense]|uniref:ADF-H domain-containing protein n=3 Tax=Gossypium TaxID=3633 RepID=A0A2P5XV40_GOSBA|nr:hypothetical protein GOBAR_AA13430 [Gossypium barbadense]